MPLVWCSISHHGFGHGAQLIPVLNELSRQVPGLRVLLRTSLPQTYLQSKMECPWEVLPAEQDVGCVQYGPLQIDVPKTWEAYERFHVRWEQKVRDEANIMHAKKPSLIVSNISYFGIDAGACAGYPAVALSSLSWDQVLAEFVTNGSDSRSPIVDHIRQSYQKADRMIRLAPGIQMTAFKDIVDVGPIYSQKAPNTGTIRKRLGVTPDEKLVLVAFGGIPLLSLPVDQLEHMTGYRFLIGGSARFDGCSRLVSTNELSLPFDHLVAEADVVITKPGYATIVDCVNHGVPIIYVRRYNFVDEQLLVDYAHEYVPSLELSLERFQAGNWKETLDRIHSIPCPYRIPPQSGVLAAATALAEYLS